MKEKIEKSNVQDIVELDRVQEGMLFHYLKESGESLYNIRLSLNVKGGVDANILRDAIHLVQAGNDVLRSVLRWEEVGKPVQIILKECAADLSYMDISAMTEEDREDHIYNFLHRWQDERFDLEKLAFRVSLIKAAEDSFVLSFAHHHILYDGWSTGILLKELFACYNQLCAHQQPYLPAKPGYKEIRKAIQGNAGRLNGEDFWRNYLQDHELTTLFPPARTAGGAREEVKCLSLHQQGDRLKAFAAKYKVTAASILYTAYAILLQRYNDTGDVVFGTTVSSRDASIGGIESVMGNFINTVPLRIRTTEASTVLDIIRSVSRDLSDRDRYYTTSYSGIKQLLNLKPEDNLFDSVVVIENYPLDEAAINSHGGLTVRLRSFYENTDIPVLINIFLRDDLEMVFSYRESSTRNIDMNSFAGHFTTVLAQLLENPGTASQNLALLSQPETDRILREFNETKMEYPREMTLVELFEAQVLRTRYATALELHGQSMSYAELNEKANGLAVVLRERGIRPNQVVGLYTSRSLEMFISIIAVLKSGGCYLPLDPGYPAERIAYMLRDTGASIVIVSGDLVPPPIMIDGPIELIRIRQEEMGRNSDDLPIVNAAEDLAYVIYTSGSTGLPKGVMLSHRSVHNYIRSMSQQIPFGKLQTIASVTTYSFDIFVTESLLPLTQGLKVVIADEATQKDPQLLNEMILTRKVQLLQTTPSRYQLLLSDRLSAGEAAGHAEGLAQLEYLLVGGEGFPNELLHRLKGLCRGRIINVYGPTETTVWSTLTDLTHADQVNIGRPIGNTEVYVLGSGLQVQPIGVTGDLYIGGDGLAVGYWNNDELTDRVFIPNPFLAGKKMYKTGDKVRWLPNGSLEYIGRADSQVKIRGHRIEMEELESHLLKHPKITACAVTVRKSRSGEDVLCAYYTSADPISQAGLLEYVARSLPEHLVPAYLGRLGSIPYTSNGKIDRKALPDPEISREADYVEPAGELQWQLAAIWADILKIDKDIIGAESGFFQMGGHSLSATALVNRLRKQLGIAVPLNEFFKRPTIAGLSAFIRSSAPARYASIPKAVEKAWYPLSSSQKRLYFLYEMDPAALSYNLHIVIKWAEMPDRERVQVALSGLIMRHETLRTSFRLVNNEPVQVIAGQADPEVGIYEERTDEATMISRFRKPFDLSRPPLLRAALFPLDANEYALLLDFHHIIVDKLSLDVLRTEFDELYAGHELPVQMVQYKDYSEWQHSPEYNILVKQQGSYWLRLLQDDLPVLRLPADPGQTRRSKEEGGIVSVYLAPWKKKLIRDYCRINDVTAPVVLYSLFSILLAKLSGQNDIVIGLSIAGRNHSDLERVVGMFVNALPIRSFPAMHKPLNGFIREIKASTLAAYENQDCPFESLVEQLGIQRDSARNPIFDVMLNVMGESPESIDTTAKPIEKYEHFTWTKRFDLTLNVTELPNSFQLQFQYDTGLFHARTAETYLSYFVNIISALDGPEGMRLSDIAIVQEKTIRQIFDQAGEEDSPVAALPAPVPASYHQERLWFIDRFESGSLYEKGPVYHNIPMLLSFSGKLDRTALENSIRQMINKYPILRTCIVTIDEQPYQTLVEDFDARFGIKDVPVDESEWEERTEAEINIAFELNQPLIRCTLLNSGAERHRLIMVIHHSIADRYSVNRLAEEILSAGEGTPPSYAAFSQWQRNTLATLEPYFLSYWKHQLGGRLKNLELPTDRPRAAIHVYTAASAGFSLPRETVEKLTGYASVSGIPAGVLLMAAFKILLFDYSRHEEIVIGTSVDNREGERMQRLIGPVANLIVLRSFISARDSFAEYAAALHQTYREAVKFGAMPFDKLVKELAPEKDMSRTALFDVLYQFESAPVRFPAVEGLDVSLQDMNYGYGKYDLNLLLQYHQGAIEGKLVFNREYFDPSWIRSFVAQYTGLTRNLLADPDVPISGVERLSGPEKHRLLQAFDHTGVGYPKDETIVSLFARQVNKHPANIAVKDGKRTLRYDELDRRSTALARLLNEKGVTGNAVVGLLTDRSAETIVGILAILKAGGAYLPIDVDYPKERKEYIIRDSGTGFLVTTRDVNSDAGDGLVKIFIEDALHREAPPAAPENVPGPFDLCYIIYTSGTTGNPKGVMVEHRNVVRLFFNDAFPFAFTSDDVWTLFHSHCFDFSVWEMYGALFFGGRLIVIPKMTARDTAAYLSVLKEEAVTVLNQTPSAFYPLIREELACPDARLSIRYIIFGGEALSPGKLKHWRSKYPGTQLINMFGITETTVHVTYKLLGEHEIDNNINNIGKPIPTLSVYLLDEQLCPVPQGRVGELYVGGAGVARGYWGREELTKKRFIADPYRPGERLYRSGDLARVLGSGDIQYIGRADQQIQLRGFRIEPGEIETVLTSHPQVKEAVVVDKGSEGNKYLVAYYVAAGEISTAGMRSFLSDRQPDYMIPSYFVPLTRLPLTTNGKLDRNALPEPEVRIGDDYAAPGTPEEILLADIWSEVLGVENPGVKSNFFLMGGDSIKSIQISSRVRNAGYEMPVKDIFSHQTIRELAPRLKRSTALQSQELVTGEGPLSPFQRWFLMDPAAIDAHHFNQSVTLTLPGEMSRETVMRIFTVLVQHHDALRMVFRARDGVMVQENLAAGSPPSIEEFDVRQRGDAAALIDRESARMQSGFDLRTGPLIKLGLFHRVNGTDLLIIIHHLVVDGISWRILLEDIETLYRQVREGDPLALPLKTGSFLSWCRRLSALAGSAPIEAERAYWNQVAVLGAGSIIRDHAEGSNFVKDGVSESFSLTETETHLLLTKAHFPFGTQITDLLLAALTLCIREKFGMGTVRIDLEGHGREDILEDMNVDRTVGWFTSVYPVVLGSQGADIPGTVQRVKETLRGIPNKGIGYLLLNPAHAGSGVCFNYLGQFDTGGEDRPFLVTPQTNGVGVSPRRVRSYDWEISGLVSGRQLSLSLLYSGEQFEAGTISDFMARYKRILTEVIDFCCSCSRKELTPSDLSYKYLPATQLDLLQREYTVEDVYPLSPMQEGMLFHTLAEPDSRHYFEQIILRVTGKLDIAAIKKCMNDLARRYDVLRTSFVYNGDERPLQVVERSRETAFTFRDIREESREKNSRQVISDHRAKVRSQNFDLSHGSLIRLHVFQTTDEHYEFLFSYHHLLMDGWCMGILIKDFKAMYAAITGGTTAGLLPVSPYSRYIGWLEKREKEPSINYWQHYLQGYDGLASLPGKRMPETENPPYRQAIVQLLIAGEETNGLRTLCGKHGVTLNTLLQSCWGLLLSRYNDSSDVVFGTVVSGRPPEIGGIENMVGLFINTIPVRISFGSRAGFGQLVEEVQRAAIECEPHHYHPLAEIQALTSLKTGLLDHILIMENYPIANELKGTDAADTGGFIITDVEVFEQSNYDFSIVIIPGESIAIKFVYNDNIYTGEAVRAIADDLHRVIRQMVRDDGMPISAIELVAESGKNRAGRKEDRIKIGGNRINCREVNHWLLACQGIKEAAVVPVERQDGTCLAAYYTADQDIGAETLRRRLSTVLPDYMLPAYFVRLAEIPLSPDGIVQRNKLPDLETDRKQGQGTASDPIQEKLVEIWAEVLKLKKDTIRVDKNFLEMGGHSLKAAAIVNKIQKSLEIEVPIMEIFHKQNIENLADYIVTVKQMKEGSADGASKIKFVI